MKRLSLISLTVLLAVSLGIAMLPAQPVKAIEPGATVYHIQAEGEGEYQFPGNTEWQTGDFFINVVGKDANRYTMSQGYGTPKDTVGGHIRGSFGGHEINISLRDKGSCLWWDTGGKLKTIGFQFQGIYDGNRVTSPQSYIRIYYDGDEVDYIVVEIMNVTPQVYIRIHDASVDIH
ncbi:hypothetical protein ACFLW4_07425 [Chloroflexota bacterium]